MSLEDFIIVVYGWVDDQLKEWLGPTRRLRQRGFAPQLSDSEAITLVVVGEFLGYDTDVGIWAYFRQHWAAWFPGLRSRSGFARQAANLWVATQALLATRPQGVTCMEPLFYGVILRQTPLADDARGLNTSTCQAQVRLEDTETSAIIKRLPERSLAVECLCAQIGRALGLHIPRPMILIDRQRTLMLGAGAEAYADDPLMAARLVARGHASLCHRDAMKAIGVEQNETKRDNELNAWVKLTQDIAVRRNPALRGRFNQKVSLIGDETVTLPYAAPNKALNLGLLSPSRARRNIESIKLKLWNLQSLPASYRIRHLVLGVPRDDAPEMASVKTRQLMEKSLRGLREQVSENHLNVALATVHSAQEAAEHILDLDRAA